MNTTHQENTAVPLSENAPPAEAKAPQATPTEIVDALNGVFGRQPQTRAIHAKGIALAGTFTPSATAPSISKAPHLQRGSVPTTVRFSNFSGVAATSDLDPNASPRGLALRFHLADGTFTDIVSHSFNGFPTRTADEFRQLFVALKASGPGSASPTALERFFAAHPTAQAFLSAPKPPPVSYATLPYFGVNSFKFTNQQGDVRYGRYRIMPLAGSQFLSPDEQKQKGPTYLLEEISARVSQQQIAFSLQVQIARPGDVIDDPSRTWPDSREIVPLGTLELLKLVDDPLAAERSLVFSPATVPAGIEPADPMVQIRSAAYGVSYARRHG